MLEAREEARNPLDGVGLLPLLSLLWSRLLVAAVSRSRVARLVLRSLYRIEGRLRHRRYEIEGQTVQLGGDLLPPEH